MSKPRGSGVAAAWLQAHVAYQGSDCLIWPYSRSRQKGYGFLVHEGVHHYAHRFMCELVNGLAPSPKHQASHSCGRGHNGCVNPLHLSWKTNSENQLDRRTHGTLRNNRGQTRAKLTTDQIADVRALKGKVTQYDLAKRFGVKPGCIEYWQRHDKPPVAPSSTQNAEYHRRKRNLDAARSA